MSSIDILVDAGFDNVLLLSNYSYDKAIVGVTTNNQAVYSFKKMVQWLMETEKFTQEEAIEWIEYNTIRSLPHYSPEAPIIMYDLEEYK